VEKWPFRKLFFFASMMYMGGYIRVGRNGDPFAFVESCWNILRNGGVLVCFPEGTRSRDGELGPFHAGIFRVSVAAGADIVPMILHNTGRVCRPGPLLVRPETVRISLLEPLAARTDLSPRQACRELMDRTRRVMEAALQHA
jgi:1-acyl-sn-glycerol-3-phosphate acyltransferase